LRDGLLARWLGGEKGTFRRTLARIAAAKAVERGSDIHAYLPGTLPQIPSKHCKAASKSPGSQNTDITPILFNNPYWAAEPWFFGLGPTIVVARRFPHFHHFGHGFHGGFAHGFHFGGGFAAGHGGAGHR
jgi:hypothetical protein